MEFEWDPGKARANLAKHGIDFADAALVLYDESALTLLDDHPLEERFATIGADALGRVLVVAYTWRGDVARIMATARERALYKGRG